MLLVSWLLWKAHDVDKVRRTTIALKDGPDRTSPCLHSQLLRVYHCMLVAIQRDTSMYCALAPEPA